jgi:hypothetical protein
MRAKADEEVASALERALNAELIAQRVQAQIVSTQAVEIVDDDDSIVLTATEYSALTSLVALTKAELSDANAQIRRITAESANFHDRVKTMSASYDDGLEQLKVACEEKNERLNISVALKTRELIDHKSTIARLTAELNESRNVIKVHEKEVSILREQAIQLKQQNVDACARVMQIHDKMTQEREKVDAAQRASLTQKTNEKIAYEVKLTETRHENMSLKQTIADIHNSGKKRKLETDMEIECLKSSLEKANETNSVLHEAKQADSSRNAVLAAQIKFINAQMALHREKPPN